MSSAIIVPPRYAIPSRDQYGPGFRYIHPAATRPENRWFWSIYAMGTARAQPRAPAQQAAVRPADRGPRARRPAGEPRGTWQMVRLSGGTDHAMLRIAMPFTGAEAHVTFSAQALVRLKTRLQRAGLVARFTAGRFSFRLAPYESCLHVDNARYCSRRVHRVCSVRGAL